MHKLNALFKLALAVLLGVALLIGPSSMAAENSSPTVVIDEVISSDTVWDEPKIYNNESVIVSNNQNLTIVDTYVNFTNFVDTGIIVDGGILKIVNSTIQFGDKCISGETSGTVMIYDSVIENCLGDAIELEGDYDFHLEKSIIRNGEGKGVDLTGLAEVEISSSSFSNLVDRAIAAENVTMITVSDTSVSDITEDRGMRFEGTGSVHLTDITVKDVTGDAIRSDVDGSVFMENILIDGSPDDGVQIENAANATLVNVKLENVAGDGFKGEAFDLYQVFDSVALNVGGDGVDFTEAEKAVLRNVTLSGSADTGFEADFLADMELTNMLIDSSGEFGIEIANSTSLSAVTTVVKDSGDVGVYLDTMDTFTMDNSSVTGNEGGFLFINTSSADIHHSIIMSNNLYAINATAVGEGIVVNATSNYWGTTLEDAIVTYGNVTIEPLLDADMALIGSDTDGLPITPLPIVVVLVSIPILRRYKHN